jgi:nucleoside-triphosphatase THEP1
MECLSRAFVAAVTRLFDSSCNVIATVAQRGTGFIAEVKRHPRAELWEVTRANRDTLPGRIVSWLDVHG